MNTVTPPCNGATPSKMVFENPLLFYASPHENGTTRRLLDQVLPNFPLAREPEIIRAFDTQIRPCTDCRACYQEECPLNGDGMGELLEKAQKADLIITASPVYFNGMPSPMKAILDRTQQLFVKKFIQHEPVFSVPKAGILLTTAGSDDRAGNEGDGVMNGATAARGISATNGVREMIRMFYGCLGALPSGHIAVTGTDHNPSFTVESGEIRRVLQRLEAFLRSEASGK